jgi:hypothetical protein
MFRQIFITSWERSSEGNDYAAIKKKSISIVTERTVFDINRNGGVDIASIKLTAETAQF